jgi:hypothetical protein
MRPFIPRHWCAGSRIDALPIVLSFCGRAVRIFSKMRTPIAALAGACLLASVLHASPRAFADAPATASSPAPSNGAMGAPVVTWITPGGVAPSAPSASPASRPGPGTMVPTQLPAIPTAGAHGLAVVAIADAGSVAWPLAQALYADASLRPSFDEAHARVLVGEAPAADASTELRDLGDTRAAIHGQDAPSRQLLAGLASSLHVTGVVVVQRDGDATASARVFVAATGAFDAARYSPDPGPQLGWRATVESLHRAFGPVVALPPVATAAVPPPPRTEDHTRAPFYKSPWFWGALGAAAFGAGAVYFATRDNSPDTIHLQVQVPK